MNETRESGRGGAGRLVFGGFLVLFGAVLLADNFGIELPGEIWNYWPFLLIGLGAAKLFWPGRGEGREGGLWLLTAGVYCWLSSWRIYGLHWGTAWPIYLVTGGAVMLFEGLRCRRPAAAVAEVTEVADES